MLTKQTDCLLYHDCLQHRHGIIEDDVLVPILSNLQIRLRDEDRLHGGDIYRRSLEYCANIPRGLRLPSYRSQLESRHRASCVSAKLRGNIHQLIRNNSDRRDRLVPAVSDHLQFETTRSSIMGCVRYSWHRRNVSFCPLSSICRTRPNSTSSVPIISAGRIHSLTNAPPKGYMSTACWTIAEIGVGVITASLATIRHLRDRKMRSLLSTGLSGNHRDSVSEGILQGPAQQIPHHMTGSQVDLVSHNQSGHAASGSLGSISKMFSKKQGSRASIVGIHDLPADLTANEGATKTTITSSRRRRKEVPMAAGAADFLGEFGVLVERTWEVQEIRME